MIHSKTCSFESLQTRGYILYPDLSPGDCVSVFTDVDGKCKRGLVVEYEGRTLFVGNGHVKLSRRDLFGSHATNRLDDHHHTQNYHSMYIAILLHV